MSRIYRDDDASERVELSAAGTHRREAILREAIRSGHRRRRRRQVVRGAGAFVAAAVVLAVGSAAFVTAVRHSVRPSLPPAVAPVVTRPVAPRATGVIVQRIETDPTLLDRLAVPPEAPGWQRVSDEELLRQLAHAGRPAALAYVGGEAELLWRERTSPRPRPEAQQTP